MEYKSVKQLIRSSLMVPSLDLNFAATKELDSRISFTRASGATYIGPTGLVEYAPENLILRSEEFNTTWTPSGATVTANATTNPFGSLTAFKLVENTSSDYHEIQQDVSLGNQMVCFSVYAKAGSGARHLVLSLGEGAGYKLVIFYNLTDGTVTNSTNQGSWAEISAGSTDVGGGWYRYFIVARQVTGSFTRCRIGLHDGTFDYYQGDGVSNILIWGAQLQRSSSATGYLRTTTSAVYGPRFTHDLATGKSLGLFIEGSRTNLFNYSEQIDNAGWLKTGIATVSADNASAPTGATTADLLTENSTASTQHRIYQVPTVANGTTYTVSAFVKRGSGSRHFGIILNTGTVVARVYFDLETGALGTVVSGSGTITSYPNGWYRCTATGVSGGVTGTVYLQMCNGTTSGSETYSGDGTSGMYIWGTQLEAGEFASSYIPNTSGASSVNRAADQVQITGTNFSSWYNQNQGTVILEATHGYILPSSAFLYPFQISNSTGTESFGAFNTNNSSQNVTYILGTTVAGGQYMQFSTNKLFGTGTYKTAVSYSADSVFTSNDGSPVSSDTSVAIPSVDRLTIGGIAVFGSSAFFNGAIGRFRYFNRALSQNKLSVLSS